MSQKLSFKFRSDLPHQNQAVESMIDVFKGVGQFYVDGMSLGDEVFKNIPDHIDFDENFLLGNLQEIQSSNDIIPISSKIEYNLNSATLDLESFGAHNYPVYTLEMETGTGKTYVYLKSIFEMNKEYGFNKFVLVVPSVAIWEGALKTIEQTRSHFKSEFGKQFNPYVLKGKNVKTIKNFATDSGISLLILTIDSFNRKSNQVYKTGEMLDGSPYTPIEYIRKTRPILLLDESQNYLTSTAQKALSTLSPLVAFNFSATPKVRPNLIHYLSPVDALRYNLVKRIQVLGVSDEEDNNLRLGTKDILLESVKRNARSEIVAKLKLYKIANGQKKKSSLSLKKNGTDLFLKTKNPDYKGLIVEGIKLRPQSIEFTNGEVIKAESTEVNIDKKELFREQIKQTIRFHIAKQRELVERGIKVLSVFFIDKVSNYAPEDSLIKQIFKEEFDKQKNNLHLFNDLEASDVSASYFSSASINGSTYFIDELDEELDKSLITKLKKKQAEAQKESFELIMKGKERLLKLSNKKSFIFAHSALKEGWDNPNVFQICTLRESPSEDTKRQIIGRGLRISVDQTGERCFDKDVNILTVIPNESYRSFCAQLQAEYENNGDIVPVAPRNARKDRAKRNDDAYESKEFKAFWNKLLSQSKYEINVDTDKLISECLTVLNSNEFKVDKRKITLTFGEFSISRISIRLISVNGGNCRFVITKKNTIKDAEKFEVTCEKGDSLSKYLKELEDFEITKIIDRGESSVVEFSNGSSISYNKRIRFHVEGGLDSEENEVFINDLSSHKVDFINRGMEATQLTRRTLLRVAEGLSESKKELYKVNPEGFTSSFVSIIRDVLRKHVAENVKFEILSGKNASSLDELFPKEQSFVQSELIDGSKNSLYSQIQTDSTVERNFVQNKLFVDDEEGNILTYFKFPAKYKVNFPKIIGNYNPDWGIIRKLNSGSITMELVRETKGNEDVAKLQRSNEGYKIKCAEKYYKKLGVDYRHVTDKTSDWMN